MARRNRQLKAFRTYLTTQSGNKNQPLFADAEDIEVYRRMALERAKAMRIQFLRILIHPNGVLHLVMAANPAQIPLFESQVKSQYSRYLNDKYCDKPDQLTGSDHHKGKTHVGEANFRPRFDSLELESNHLEQLKQLGWKVDELPTTSSPLDLQAEQSEWLRAAEAVIRGMPALLVPRPEQQQSPVETTTKSPRYTINSPFWRDFPINRCHLQRHAAEKTRLLSAGINTLTTTVKQQSASRPCRL
jgi:hypothetical protein